MSVTGQNINFWLGQACLGGWSHAGLFVAGDNIELTGRSLALVQVSDAGDYALPDSEPGTVALVVGTETAECVIKAGATTVATLSSAAEGVLVVKSADAATSWLGTMLAQGIAG